MAKRRRVVGTGLLAAGLILVILAAFTVISAKSYFNRERVIFAMADPKGDDYGPGSYKYPIDSLFDPKKELFDLTGFSFSAQRNNYYFDLTFPRVTNPWGAAEGFSHTIIEIYIADGPDSGRIEPFKEGANVLFDPGNPWKYLIKVVSFNKTAVFWDSDFAAAEGRNTGVAAKLRPDRKTIRVTVPKSLLPGDPYTWRYYILVGSQEGSGPDNFRPVRSRVSQWYFGGGTDTDYSPNVIDLLAPPGEQERMLGSFSVAGRRQAVIRPVGPAPARPGIWERLMDETVQVLQKCKVRL